MPAKQVSLEPVAASRVLAAGIADAVRSLARLALRRRRRTRDRVMAEYDATLWTRVLTERPLENARTLEEWIIGTDRRPMLAKVDGRVVRVRRDHYYRLRRRRVGEALHAQLGSEHDIVEIGCGFGYNLFSVAELPEFAAVRFIGLDISEQGIGAARRVAEHFGLADRISFDLLDITQADHPNYALLDGRNVFSYFCLEQLPYDVIGVIENIRARRPRRVVHVEPTTELLQRGVPLDWLNYLYAWSMDYQRRLFSALAELEARKAIRVCESRRLDFAPTIHHDGFLLAWEPL